MPEPEATEGRESASTRTFARASIEAPTQTRPTASESSQKGPEPRGIALPGDRGRNAQDTPKRRPSFWRRIALGRLGTKPHDEAASLNPQIPAPAKVATSVAPDAAAVQRQAGDSIEKRVVEPLLQALVSVESKLERSHVELVGRSDEIEQRLTQLWDIEEQLGALGELQESLLQVSEQQRRLEATIAAQNRSLRWLVGAIFFSLAVAAFVVAAVLQ